MKLSRVKNEYIFNTRIDLDGGDYITLREPSMRELNEINEAGRNVSSLSGLFPACLIDHSFTNEDGGKAKPTEVYEALKESGSLFTEILAQWLQNIPFQQRLRKERK
jgi:hypothetical protein